MRTITCLRFVLQGQPHIETCRSSFKTYLLSTWYIVNPDSGNRDLSANETKSWAPVDIPFQCSWSVCHKFLVRGQANFCEALIQIRRQSSRAGRVRFSVSSTIRALETDTRNWHAESIQGASVCTNCLKTKRSSRSRHSQSLQCWTAGKGNVNSGREENAAS